MSAAGAAPSNDARGESSDVERMPPRVGPSGTAYSGADGVIEPGPSLPRPQWLHDLLPALERAPTEHYTIHAPPDDEEGRESAVLILFGPPNASTTGAKGEGAREAAASGGLLSADVLLLERAHTMRSHPGQLAFPGGARDPEDPDLIATALREAEEETGLDPAGVEIVTTLPELFLPPSRFRVTPVVGWWRHPSPVRVVDRREVHDVMSVPLAHLLDPDNRFVVGHPSGFKGPGFDIDGLLLWGFTAGLLSRSLDLSGQVPAWDESMVKPLPSDWTAIRAKTLLDEAVQEADQ